MVVLIARYKDGGEYQHEFATKSDEYRQMVDNLYESDEVTNLELEITSGEVKNHWSPYEPGKRRFSSRQEFVRFAKSLTF